MQVTESKKRTFFLLSVMWPLMVIAAEAGDTGRAKAIFSSSCAVCHGGDGKGKMIGHNRFPGIAGLPQWYLEDQLIKFKYDGRGADYRDKEGLMMHAMVRTLRRGKSKADGVETEYEKDIEEIAAFISRLAKPSNKKQTVKGDAENGRKIYTAEGVMGCVRCHGDRFQGRETEDPAQQIPRTPPLGTLDDWYVLAQLEKFRSGVRGQSAKTAVAEKLEEAREKLAERRGRKETLSGEALMAAMSQTAFAGAPDPDQAMRDVVAYIFSESRKTSNTKKP